MCNLNRIVFCLILAALGRFETRAVEIPELFDFQVIVTDASGNPINGANVDLVGLEKHSDIVHRTPGAITVEPIGNGLYQATVSISDPRLLRHDESLLVVSHPNRLLHTDKLWFARLITGVPLRVTLADAAPRTVRVVDSQGNPIEGATIQPAVWDRTVVPLYEKLPKVIPTAADGKTSAVWIDPGRLSMVYIQAESIGNQRVPIKTDTDGSVEVVAMPAFDIQGRWSSPIEMADYPTFFETPILVRPSVSDKLYGGQLTNAYSWAETKLNRDGTFAPVRVSEGSTVVGMNLPCSIPLATESDVIEVSPGEPIELKFFKGIRVRGKVIEENTDKPLSGIQLRQFTFCREQPLTAEDGSFELWFHPDDRISFYPDDATGRRMSSDSFYHYPVELPVDGKLDLKPTPLVSMAECIGTVVDGDGNPVPGATITGNFKSERFNAHVFFYSDVHGNFPFLRVQPNATIELTAKADGMMSTEPVNFTLSPEAKPKVVIEPRHAIRVRGTVVDKQSNPITGASVLLRTAYVNQEESYSGEDASAMALTDSVDPIVTDATGQFVSSPILDWQRRFSLEVGAPGYRTLQNYWTDGSRAGKTKTDLDFGTLAMLPNWSEVEQTIEIVDSECGKPLPGTRVVCRGAYVDQQRATSDDSGRVEFKLRDSTAVFAADCDGYHPAFEVRHGGSSLDKIALVPDHLPAPVRRGVTFDKAERIELARQLLSKIDKPTPRDTPNRLLNYYRSLQFVDIDKMMSDVNAITAMPGIDPDLKLLLSSQLIGSKGQTTDQTETIENLIDDAYRYYWVMEQAKKAASKEEQLDLFGEAMVLVEKQSGDDALCNIGYLAIELLKIDEQETAEQLLIDAYRDHGKLQRILDEGKREQVAGVARVFLPVYAIAEPERSIELIRLTAFPNEVPRLQTMAVRFAAEYVGKDPAELVKSTGLETLDPWGLVNHYVNVRHRDVDAALAIADLCEDGSAKADFMIDLAKNSTTNRETKTNLARRALEIVKQEEQQSGQMVAGTWLLEHAGKVVSWDPRLAEDYRFEAFWSSKEANLITPFPQVSKMAEDFASTDVEVARALIEPCFDDWSWLFGAMDAEIVFSDNGPLHAAAAIDHKWTITFVDDLFEQHLSNQPSRKFETIGGVIRSLK